MKKTFREDRPHTVINSARLRVFSFFLPSEKKPITSHFPLQVLLARNVAVL